MRFLLVNPKVSQFAQKSGFEVNSQILKKPLWYLISNRIRIALEVFNYVTQSKMVAS